MRQLTSFYWSTWKDANRSFNSKFGGWLKCHSCAAKLVKSSRNACNMRVLVHRYCLYWEHRLEILCSANHIKIKGGWRKTAHHLTLAATKLFLVDCELYFAAVTQHHPAYAGNHCLLETRKIKICITTTCLFLLSWTANPVICCMALLVNVMSM